MRSDRQRHARLAATAIDFIVLLLVGFAILIALNGGLTIGAGALRVTARGPWRALLAAMALAAIRIGLTGRATFAPASAPDPDRDADRDLARLLGETRPPPSLYAAGALLIVVCAIALRGQLLHPRSVPDFEDPLFSAWRIAWVAHQIVRAPLHLFDANIFFPLRLTFTYSDSMLLPAVVAAPGVWLGIDPLVASNILLVAAFPLCAIAFCWTTYRFTGNVGAALVAGLAAGLYPYHFEHYSHLELQMFCWVPIAVLCLARVLRRGSVNDGLALGAAVAAQALSSMYYGFMLALYLVPAAIVMAIGWRVKPTARLARAAAVATLVAIAAAAVLGPPYVRSLRERGGRNAEVTTAYSARPEEWLVASVRNATWGESRPSDPAHYPERELFPGAGTPLLALVGVAPPWSVPVAGLLAGGVAAFDWSLGLNGATYRYLRDWLLPFRSLRSPVRFAVLCGSSLILLAGFGASRLIRASRARGWQVAVTAVLAALLLIDLRPRVTLVSPWPSMPPIYASVTPEMVLAEYPMQLGHNIAYMYFSTSHWARLVNGYSGYIPQRYERLERDAHDFWTVPSIERLRADGVTHMTVNCAFYEDAAECARDLAALDRTDRVRPVAAARWEGADVRLYALRAPGRIGMARHCVL